MAKPIIIWGSSGHAKVLQEFLPDIGFELIALFDTFNADTIDPKIPCFLGMPKLDKWLEERRNLTPLSALVAIGGSRGKERLAIQCQMESKGIVFPKAIHPTAFVANNAEIGAGSQILANSSVCAEVHLGFACIINTKASVDHECIIGNGVHIGPGATLAGCVKVGDHAFIATSATVLPRITIGRNSIVGAGALVTQDVPDGIVVIGQPARFHRTL